MDKVEVKELIVCSKARRGDGKQEHSPVRVVVEIFEFDGTKIAEKDCNKFTVEEIHHLLTTKCNLSPVQATKAICDWVADLY